MGEVIRKDAATADIIADVRATLRAASARGGKWREIAELKLVPVLTLFDGVETQRKAAGEQAAPLQAQLDAENERADDVLGKVSDDVWNAVGRPASDPALSILFPGGASYYAEGDVSEQPDRMDVLVQLLGSGIHPKLTQEKAQAAASEVSAAAAALRQTVDATRVPVARLGVLNRVRTAVARSAALELSNVKRLYKASGFSETEIHTVIPSRARPRQAKPE